MGEENTQYYHTLIHLVMADAAYAKENGMWICFVGAYMWMSPVCACMCAKRNTALFLVTEPSHEAIDGEEELQSIETS